MEHIYDEKPQFQDNRTYNIVVQDGETKDRFNKLLEGKRPEIIEGEPLIKQEEIKWQTTRQ